MKRRWKKHFSIDKWNNNLRLKEKTLKFSFKDKLKKYSRILNLQEKKHFSIGKCINNNIRSQNLLFSFRKNEFWNKFEYNNYKFTAK
jgi:hypothetical protein